MTTTTDMTEAQPARRRTGSKILASLAVLAVAGGALTISSLALFTDQQNVTGNAFSTGTVNIDVSPATVAITDLAMAPGDQVTSEVTVANLGSLTLRYAMTSTTTEDVLASELDLTIKSGVSSCTDANWQATGSVVYTGLLGSTGTTAVIGSNAQGAQAGDRTLANGGSEVLCFNVTLPLSASNTSQNLTTTATFAFDAEQTANN